MAIASKNIGNFLVLTSPKNYQHEIFNQTQDKKQFEAFSLPQKEFSEKEKTHVLMKSLPKTIENKTIKVI